LNDAAFLADAGTGIILEANKQAEKLLGRSRDEIIGVHRSQLHPTEEEERYRQQFEARAAGDTAMHDSHIIRKDGTIVPVIISGGPIIVEGRQCVLGLFRDVTEQKRAEEALRQSEERFRMLSQATSEGVGIAEKGIVVDVSARFADMLGYEPEEIIGRPAAAISLPESSLRPTADLR
jgi:PAS domain S-box-containing protein